MGFLDGSKAELTWIREQRTLCLGVFRPAGRAFQSLTPSQKDSPPPPPPPVGPKLCLSETV